MNLSAFTPLQAFALWSACVVGLALVALLGLRCKPRRSHDAVSISWQLGLVLVMLLGVWTLGAIFEYTVSQISQNTLLPAFEPIQASTAKSEPVFLHQGVDVCRRLALTFHCSQRRGSGWLRLRLQGKYKAHIQQSTVSLQVVSPKGNGTKSVASSLLFMQRAKGLRIKLQMISHQKGETKTIFDHVIAYGGTLAFQERLWHLVQRSHSPRSWIRKFRCIRHKLMLLFALMGLSLIAFSRLSLQAVALLLQLLAGYGYSALVHLDLAFGGTHDIGIHPNIFALIARMEQGVLLLILMLIGSWVLLLPQYGAPLHSGILQLLPYRRGQSHQQLFGETSSTKYEWWRLCVRAAFPAIALVCIFLVFVQEGERGLSVFGQGRIVVALPAMAGFLLFTAQSAENSKYLDRSGALHFGHLWMWWLPALLPIALLRSKDHGPALICCVIFVALLVTHWPRLHWDLVTILALFTVVLAVAIGGWSVIQKLQEKERFVAVASPLLHPKGYQRAQTLKHLAQGGLNPKYKASITRRFTRPIPPNSRFDVAPAYRVFRFGVYGLWSIAHEFMIWCLLLFMWCHPRTSQRSERVQAEPSERGHHKRWNTPYVHERISQLRDAYYMAAFVYFTMVLSMSLWASIIGPIVGVSSLTSGSLAGLLATSVIFWLALLLETLPPPSGAYAA